ncbi:Zinc finger protein [Operophtera brumata]|uniref:Zinc finger protein n=1 Tax=Operophtera brumata TaxID=104452 RepID=A0A0L7KPZ9_OPEBR|nr:Zinc finger protein [Operophtera brumata]
MVSTKSIKEEPVEIDPLEDNEAADPDYQVNETPTNSTDTLEYGCDVCNKRFSTRTKLPMQQNIHSARQLTSTHENPWRKPTLPVQYVHEEVHSKSKLGTAQEKPFRGKAIQL